MFWLHAMLKGKPSEHHECTAVAANSHNFHHIYTMRNTGTRYILLERLLTLVAANASMAPICGMPNSALFASEPGSKMRHSH